MGGARGGAGSASRTGAATKYRLPPGPSPIGSGFAAGVRIFGGEGVLSRPDLREPFYVSIWFGQGVIWVGILCVVFLCVWPSVVPNQRQLSIIVSDWVAFFPTYVVGSCPCIVAVKPYKALFLVFAGYH